MRTEGYSQSWNMEDPEPIFEDEKTDRIAEDMYQIETDSGEAVFIYNQEDEVMDMVGSWSAVLDARQEYWQDLGPYEDATNGVAEHYSPEEEIRSKAGREALEEFGVEVETPKITAD